MLEISPSASELYTPPQRDVLAVAKTVERIETTLLGAVKEEFDYIAPDGKPKLWRVCGASTIALTYTLSNYHDIPVSNDPARGERFEICQGFYDPTAAPWRNTGEPLDHVYALYHNEPGYVTFIDPIYNLLWGNWPWLKGAITYVRLPLSEFNDYLKDLGIYPYDRYKLIWPDFDEREELGHEQYIAMVNSGRIENCADLSSAFGRKVLSVFAKTSDYLASIPEWQR